MADEGRTRLGEVPPSKICPTTKQAQSVCDNSKSGRGESEFEELDRDTVKAEA